MSAPNGKELFTSQGQGGEPVTDTRTQLVPSPVDSTNQHHAIVVVTPESQPSENRRQGIDAVLTQQRPRPSFDIAHQGWDASNVSTAKCDLCHRQRCGTLQKCRVCKLSICQECCVNGRLQSDRRHTIDATAVDWDAPPNSRKRKHRALESRNEQPTGVKKQRITANTRRVCGAGESRGTFISLAVDNSSPVKDIRVIDNEMLEQSSILAYNHVGLMEPRLSVAPVFHFPPISLGQPRDLTPMKHFAQYEREVVGTRNRRLSVVEEPYDDGNDRNQALLDQEIYPAMSNPRLLSRRLISPANGFSQVPFSRPVLPPISFLDPDRYGQYHQSAERLQTGSDIFNRLENLPHHHHRQSVVSETWPPHDLVSSLGVRLVDAARTKHMSSSTQIALDQRLRDEIQNEWNSHAFIGIDADAGRRYRYLLAATYFASACLGLSPQLNAAREWLCEKEQSLREMGYEPTKSAPLMDFLQEIGAWYLRQAQS
ncbi:hypothetical protein V8C37DRAFT_60314 [Trichoderma ceciliae]